jgi:hypothetical protein
MRLFHLDADYLIAFAEARYAQREHREKARADVVGWLAFGHKIGTNAIAWRQFCTGRPTLRPVLEIEMMRATLNARIVRFGARKAEKSAELFNRTGRRTSSKSDCDIAATAIVARATLATFNVDDFKRLTEFGLRVANLVSVRDFRASAESEPFRANLKL